MSRPKLQAVLKKAIDNLESYQEDNDILRRALSGVESHIFDFSPDKTMNSLRDIFAKDNITPSPKQWQELEQAAIKFANTLKANWKTPSYIYTKDSYEYRGNPANVFRHFTDNDNKYKKPKNEFNNEVFRILSDIVDPMDYYNEKSKRSSLIDAGHSLGSGVSETALAYALGNDLHSTLAIVGAVKERTRIHAIMEKIPYAFLNPDKTAFKIEVELEAKASNRSTASKLNVFGIPEQQFITLMIKELNKALDDTNWGELEGSPSVTDEAILMLSDAVNGKKTKTKRPVSKASITKTKQTKRLIMRDASPASIKKKGSNPRQWLSIVQTINSRLPEVVRANMGSPGLVNRTGRFAESTRATSVQTTPQGFPSIGYTYDKTPYGVFDRRLGALPWATPERDPGLVIEKSIRQIVSSLAIGRFYLRRE